MFDRPTKLFVILGGFFITNALIAEMSGGKIFSLEATLGLTPTYFSMLGEQDLSFNLTAGVLLWPVVFVMTDVINEYYGVKGVRFLSYLTVGLILFAFLVTYLAIQLSPANWWPTAYQNKGVPDMQKAFAAIFNQGNRIIIGSVVAFLIAQLLDVTIFHKIKSWTGDKMIWLRATGSTLISQFIDSFVVMFIAFSGIMSTTQILAIGLVGYFYKFVVAILLTPVIYLGHHIIDRYLGHETAEKMKAQSMKAS
jgi:uncharacterized integral membrane protein (TIGR00697 family)